MAGDAAHVDSETSRAAVSILPIVARTLAPEPGP